MDALFVQSSIACMHLHHHPYHRHQIPTIGVRKDNNKSLFRAVGSAKTSGSTNLQFENLIWPSPSDEIPFWKKDFPAWDMNSEHPVDIEKDSDLLHVVHVTAEMAPIAKVGGLGDVVTGLARACLSRGHKVDVMLPFYECIQKQQINDLALLTTYNSFHDGNWVPINAYRGLVSGIPVIFIEPSNQFFKGQYVYGGSYNELEAYLFFSRACLEWMQVTGIQPDIIHIHEWQTSGLPILYWDMYHYLSLQKPRLVITIHNMEHYGECSQEQLNKCGLDGSIYATVDKAVDDRTIGHNPERLCLLKGGIVYSNAVVTVSPTYLQQTLCSGWLASTLIQNRDKSKCGSFWAQSNSTVINQKQQTRVVHLYCFWTLQSILTGGVATNGRRQSARLKKLLLCAPEACKLCSEGILPLHAAVETLSSKPGEF